MGTGVPSGIHDFLVISPGPLIEIDSNYSMEVSFKDQLPESRHHGMFAGSVLGI